MKTFSFSANDEFAEELQQRADQAGVTAEELLATQFENWIRQSREEFHQSARRVLDKNAELYRRLA